MERSDKTEVSRLIKLDAVTAVEEARVDQELKAAKELGSSLAVYISQLQQERAQEQESLRQARRIRYN